MKEKFVIKWKCSIYLNVNIYDKLNITDEKKANRAILWVLNENEKYLTNKLGQYNKYNYYLPYFSYKLNNDNLENFEKIMIIMVQIINTKRNIEKIKNTFKLIK